MHKFALGHSKDMMGCLCTKSKSSTAKIKSVDSRKGEKGYSW